MYHLSHSVTIAFSLVHILWPEHQMKTKEKTTMEVIQKREKK